jgi:hypothetical protein
VRRVGLGGLHVERRRIRRIERQPLGLAGAMQSRGPEPKWGLASMGAAVAGRVSFRVETGTRWLDELRSDAWARPGATEHPERDPHTRLRGATAQPAPCPPIAATTAAVSIKSSKAAYRCSLNGPSTPVSRYACAKRIATWSPVARERP